MNSAWGKLMILSICLICFLPLEAIDPEWSWAINAGGIGNGVPISIVTDNVGNSYLTGYFYGTITLGSQTLISAYNDIFVAKIDTAGNWIWASQAGGAAWDDGDDIAVDATGCVYVCGSFEGTALFGGTVLSSAGGSNCFFAKLDQNGNWLWAKGLGGTAYDKGNSIAVDTNCNVYTTGNFQGIINLGGTTLDSGQLEDVFLTKTDSNGNWIWAIQSTGDLWAVGEALCTDSSDNIYLAASFHDEITIGSHTVTGMGANDVLVLKLNPEGIVDWTALAYGSDHEYVKGIAVDTDGAVFISGTTASTCAYFGSTLLYSFGEEDTYVAKLDSLGNWLWAVRAGGDYYERVGEICIDTQGNAIYVGTSDGTTVFGNYIVHNNGFANGFVCSISTAGSFNWVKPVICPNYSYNYGVSSDPNGNVYICGSISADSQLGNFNLDVIMGSIDIMVAKLSSASEINDWDTPTLPGIGIGNHPNPFGSKTTLDLQISKAGNYSLALFNTRGQLVMESQVEFAQAGSYQKELETNSLPSGVYFLKLKSGTLQTTHKLLIAK